MAERCSDSTNTTLLKDLGRTGIMGLIILILAWVDPFGIRSASERVSRDVFFNMTSPFYGHSWESQEDKGKSRDKISIVMVDDNALNMSGESYPPRFSFYKGILDEILKHDPIAVFFDFVFLDHFRGGQDDTENLIFFANTIKESIEKKKTRVFISSPAYSSAKTYSQNGSCFGESTVDYLKDIFYIETDPLLKENPSRINLVYYHNCTLFHELREMPSAPFALYLAYNEKMRGEFDDHDKLPENILDSEMAVEISRRMNLLEEQIILRWGESEPHEMRFFNPEYHQECSSDENGVLFRFWDRIVDAVRYGIDGGLRKDLNCYYHNTIPAEFVFDPGKLKNISTLSNEADAENILRESFSNRIVLIGGNFSGVPDQADSSVYGKVSGVSVHAMALDNFLTYGTDYVREWPSFWSGVIKMDTAVEAGLLVILGAAGVVLQRFRPWRESSFWLRIVIMLGIWIFSLATGLLVILVSFFYVGYEPANWLGFMVAAFVLSKPLAGDVLSKPIGKESGGERA